MKNSRIALLAIVLISFASVAASYFVLSAKEKRLAALTSRYKEVLSLKEEYIDLARKLKRFEGRKNLTDVKGVVRAVDEAFEPLGLKSKVKSVNIISSSAEGEERADVSVQDVNMNEAVNFLYNLENTPMQLTIKKIIIKKSFDSPELLNVIMTLSFIRP